MFSPGQAFLWTCIDVSEKYIAVGTDVGQLFLYDRSKGIICHQLSSQVCALCYYFILLLFCLSIIFLLKFITYIILVGATANVWILTSLFPELVQIRLFILHISSLISNVGGTKLPFVC